MPAIIRVQAFARMRKAQTDYQRYLLENRSSSTIQLSWFASIRRADFKVRWAALRMQAKHRAAAQLQKMARAFLARRLFRRSMLSMTGRRIYAAKTIFRAWISFKYNKRFESLLYDHKRKLRLERLERIQKARLEVEEDLEELHGDRVEAEQVVTKIKKRITQLDKFHIQADTRLSHLERELETMTPEDFERGWAEAFGNEYDCMQVSSYFSFLFSPSFLLSFFLSLVFLSLSLQS